MLVNLVRRSELICVYRALDIHSFRSEVGAISSQSVGVGSNGSYGQSDVQALSLVASPVGCQSEVKIIFIVIHSCIMHATKNK